MQPPVDALRDLYAYLVQEARVETDLSAQVDPAALPLQIAVAQRRTELATAMNDLMAAMQAKLEALQTMAAQPLPLPTPAQQLTFWLQRLRVELGTGMETFTFSPRATIRINGSMLLEHRDFFTALVVDFVQRWELALADDIERVDHVPRPQALTLGRVTSQPTWRELLSCCPDGYTLSHDDALTLVAAGCVLRLWDPFPDADRIPQHRELELDDIPYLQPTGLLEGIVRGA